MSEPLPILISRRPRQVGVDWTKARSWLGGAPRLGNVPWPRDKDGRPLHHAAQIDLADIAEKTRATGLPKTGSLAFFIGRQGAVVNVPQHMSHAPSVAPVDMPELSKFGVDSNWRKDLAGQPLSPFWPLDVTVLDVPGIPADDDYEHVEKRHAAQAAEVERHFARRQYNLSPEQAFYGAPIPDWWQIAIHYTDGLAEAVQRAPKVLDGERASFERTSNQLSDERASGGAKIKEYEKYVKMYEGRVAKLIPLQPEFVAFAEEAIAWTSGRDPWALMTADDVAHLVSLPATGNPKFHDFTSSHAALRLDQLKDAMLKALPVSGATGFATLPDSVRYVIIEKRSPRPQWWYSAIHYAGCLSEAQRLGVPQVYKVKLDWLEADRKKLAQLQPKGMLAAFRKTVEGKSKDVIDAEARVAVKEAEIAKLKVLEGEFLTFVDDVVAWTKGRDPWSFMDRGDCERFKDLLQRAKKEFDAFASSYASPYITSPETTALVALATADNRAYATLPERVRTFINDTCLLPPNVWHQMFGQGVDIQTAASDNAEEGNHLLLQLTYDDMMFWGFGDNGAYQFWISPEDLAKGNWDGATMTFECH